MKNLFVRRILLFLWGIPLVVFVAYQGGWWFTAAVALLMAVAGHELLTVLRPGGVSRGERLLVCSLLLVLPLALVLHGLPALFWIVVAGLLAAGSLALMFPPDTGVRVMVSATFSLIYIGVPFTTLLLIRQDPVWQTQWDGAAIVLYLWGGVWVTDTFAYLTGKWLGRHKLAPQLSPGKTLEGTAGGVVFALVWALGAGQMLGDTLTWTDRVLLGIIIGVLAVIGDLVESMIKRMANVKDSGRVFSGHGGVLDRFDSLLFVQPAAYLYLISAGILSSPSGSLLPGF